MIQLLIIADDFTGALDTGVQFSKRGINSLVTSAIDDWEGKITPDTDVLILDTESRYLNYDDAYTRIKNIVEKAKDLKIRYLYKKVDSALRGNVTAEIKAIIDVYPEKFIPFMPSHPTINRKLIDGVLYVDNLPVSESVFANDPYEPILESNIIKKLETEGNLKVNHVKKDGFPEKSKQLTIFDSETVKEMEHHYKNIQTLNGEEITIGCAAFAEILANHLFPHSALQQIPITKPVVVISGSVNKITQRQIEHAESHNYPRISLTAEQLMTSNYWSSNSGEIDIQSYREIINNHDLVIFETLSPKTIEHVKKYFKNINENRFVIGRSLGELTQALLKNSITATYLFTGGDTLFQTMSVLGINQIIPLTEIKSGVVLAQINWKGSDLHVITKSGGFGEPEVFEDIVDMTNE